MNHLPPALCACLVVLAGPAAWGAGAEDIIRQAAHDRWHVGKGLLPGDHHVYSICDGRTHPASLADGCYVLRLDFYAPMQSGDRDVWIVQAETRSGDDVDYHIFVVDLAEMRIRTVTSGAAEYARSVENTLLFLGGFAAPGQPQLLRVGQDWGQLESIDPGASLVLKSQDAVRVQGADLAVFLVRYDLFESSVFAVSRDLPFPVSGVFYDPYWPLPGPPLRFAFELIESSRVHG